MPLKRPRRHRPSFQDLDQYESTSSSSNESDLKSAKCKRKKGNMNVRISRAKSPPYRLRNLSHRSKINRVHAAFSDESSSNCSSVSIIDKQKWRSVPRRDANNTQPRKFRKEENKPHESLAYQRKKLEAESIKREELLREQKIRLATNQLIDKFFQMGLACRDVAQVCSEKLAWNMTEWKTLQGSLVTIYAPIAKEAPPVGKKSKPSNMKNISPYSGTWSPSLEVDALNFCILSSGGKRANLRKRHRSLGDPSQQSSEFEVVDNISDLRFVFVHRSVINEFLSDEKPSIIDFTKMKPRVQIFAFGNGQEPTSRDTILMSPKIELILCAGTIIIPTFNSLFKNSGKRYFNHLKKLCAFHPFLKVCLHPSMRRQLGNCVSNKNHAAGIDMDFLIDFLASPDLDHLPEAPSEAQPAKKLANWIKLDRNNICWLWEDPKDNQDHILNQDKVNEETLEVLSTLKTMKEIRKELYTEFRKFIIALPENHPYLERKSIKGSNENVIKAVSSGTC